MYFKYSPVLRRPRWLSFVCTPLFFPSHQPIIPPGVNPQNVNFPSSVWERKGTLALPATLLRLSSTPTCVCVFQSAPPPRPPPSLSPLSFILLPCPRAATIIRVRDVAAAWKMRPFLPFFFFLHFSAVSPPLLSVHADRARAGGSHTHAHGHARARVRLSPRRQTDACRLPGEQKSKQVAVIESLLPTCEQILICHHGDVVSLLISVLKGVCFLDAVAHCSKNNASTWCSVALPSSEMERQH